MSTVGQLKSPGNYILFIKRLHPIRRSYTSRTMSYLTIQLHFESGQVFLDLGSSTVHIWGPKLQRLATENNLLYQAEFSNWESAIILLKKFKSQHIKIPITIKHVEIGPEETAINVKLA